MKCSTSKSRNQRFCLHIAAASALLATSAFAADFSWVPVGSGTFNEAANWDPATVPGGAVDNAIFNNSGTGTIFFNAPANPLNLRFNNTSGAYIVDLGGSTLTMGTTAGGGILLGAAAGQTNNVTLRNGSISLPGTAGHVFLGVGNFAGSHGNQLTITGPVGFNSLPTNSTPVVVGVAGSNNNILNVLNGASMTFRSNAVVGSAATVGNVLNVNGGTFNIVGGNRGITTFNGTFNLTNGYADLSLIDAAGIGTLAGTSTNSTINFNSGSLFVRRLGVNNGRDFIIGDGGAVPAIFGPASSNATITIGGAASLTASRDMVINSNGVLVGTGSINLVNAGGTIRGNAGAIIAPSVVGNPALTTDDRAFGTITMSGILDSHNIAMNFDVLGATGIGTIVSDRILNTGTYIHGGTLTLNMADYFAPPDANYEARVIGFGASSGATSETMINFINGSPLAHEWRSDGLYLLLPQMAANSKWNFNGSGDWSGTINWQRFVPTGIDTTANFGTVITNAATANLDTPVTVGHVNFTSPISYAVSGGNTLTFDVSSGSATISATTGAHAITAAVALSDDLSVDVAGGASVDVTGGVTGAVAVSKSGAGVLNVGKVIVNSLAVAGGTVAVQPNGTNAGAAEMKALSITSGALNLTDNAVIVDFDVTDPSAAIRASLATGYAGGAWNGAGVNSSAANANAGHSVGYALSSEVPGAPIFGSPDATAVLLRYTRTGDANLDGITNISDFSALAANFNQSGAWVKGDFNYDGVVNISDFSLLAANFNQSAAALPRGSVPEPATLSVLSAALLLRRRSR